MSAIKKVVVIVLTALLLLTLVPQGILASSANYQTWYPRDTVSDLGPNIMYDGKNPVPVPSTDSMPLPGGISILWISDAVAESGYTFSEGHWEGKITFPDKLKNFDITKVTVQLGFYSGAIFTSLQSYAFQSADETPWGAAFSLPDTASLSIPSGAYFALKVINGSDIDLTVNIGGDHTWIRTPPDHSNYPVPELAALALFGLGIAGLVTFIFIRRKKPSLSAE